MKGFQLTSALSNSKAISIPVLEFQSIKGLTGLIRHSQGKQDMRECEVTRAYPQSGQISVPQRCAGSANESHNNPIHVIVGFFEAFSQPGLQPHAISAPTDL